MEASANYVEVKMTQANLWAFLQSSGPDFENGSLDQQLAFFEKYPSWKRDDPRIPNFLGRARWYAKKDIQYVKESSRPIPLLTDNFKVAL